MVCKFLLCCVLFLTLLKIFLKSGNEEHYETIMQSIINIFTFEGKEEVLDEYMIINLKNGKEIYTNKVHIFNIHLPNIQKKDCNNLEDYEKLLLIFNEEDDEVLNILYVNIIKSIKHLFVWYCIFK